MSEQVTKNPNASVMQLHYKFTFGKKKGKTVRDVLEEDPGYILWAQSSVPFVVFPQEILDIAAEAAQKKPEFVATPEELKTHVEVLNEVYSNLDSIGRGGVRVLHIEDNKNVHLSLRYIIDFVQSEIQVRSPKTNTNALSA